MKTEVDIKEPAISEEVAALSLPARVNLPALTHRIFTAPVVPLESLHKIARRISQIPPTEEAHNEVNRPRKTRISASDFKAESTEQPKPRIYQRLTEAFD